jgi:hypothetical protein
MREMKRCSTEFNKCRKIMLEKFSNSNGRLWRGTVWWTLLNMRESKMANSNSIDLLNIFKFLKF